MDIAALSIAMSQSRVQQAANISVMKKAMDAQEVEMTQLIETMQAAAPASEHIIDVRV
ncbi:MAG: YjfB family protein [Oscillospiraceae bacterium]|nr:YjfB family protein [Oscillospiraceae bacterium]